MAYTEEDRIWRRREAWRRYYERHKTHKLLRSKVPSDNIPAIYYHRRVDTMQHWQRLVVLMATHKDWTVAKCKAKIAQELNTKTML